MSVNAAFKKTNFRTNDEPIRWAYSDKVVFSVMVSHLTEKFVTLTGEFQWTEGGVNVPFELRTTYVTHVPLTGTTKENDLNVMRMAEFLTEVVSRSAWDAYRYENGL